MQEENQTKIFHLIDNYYHNMEIILQQKIRAEGFKYNCLIASYIYKMSKC